MTPRAYAIDLHNRAMLLVTSDPQMAFRLSVASCDADPTFAEGWAFMGAALADLGNLPAAVSALRHALRCPEGDAPGDLTPVLKHRCLVNLGHRLIDNRIVSLDTLAEAQSATMRAMAMEPEYPDLPVAPRAFARTNLSLIASLLCASGAEMAHALEGFAMLPEPPTEMGLAFACLFNGHYREGLKHFEARFPFKLPQYLSMPWPRWDGGRIDTLLVVPDMGIGDTLSFGRFITPAARRVDHLIWQVNPELVKLLTDAFRHVENVQIVPNDHQLPDVDAWCSVFSLPVALDLDDDQIAHHQLIVPVKPVEDTSWKRKGARLHVAIAWAGNAANDIDRHRSIPFTEFLALREIPGIALYSVQVGERAADLHNAGAAALVRDMSPWIRDARDTAGILAEMDLVISCESFVGHLAGAIDKRCFLLCSRFGRDWRSSPYMGDRVLWYDQTRVFRQGDDARWSPVFKRVVEELS
jgi:hypothetical protein